MPMTSRQAGRQKPHWRPSGQPSLEASVDRETLSANVKPIAPWAAVAVVLGANLLLGWPLDWFMAPGGLVAGGLIARDLRRGWANATTRARWVAGIVMVSCFLLSVSAWVDILIGRAR
jgi:hypothetical protein